MVLKVYGFDASPPCRGAFLAIRALGLDYELKPMDLKRGDHREPAYLEMNPQHTVPLLDDDGFILAESRAIATYLANKYAPDSSLYPRDPAARGLVDSRLFFDSGFFTSLIRVLSPLLYQKDLKSSLEAVPKVEENLQILEKFLEKSAYAAGEHLTLADLALLATVSSIESIGIDLSGVPKVREWLAKLKEQLPYYEVNAKGAKALGEAYCKMRAECEGSGQ